MNKTITMIKIKTTKTVEEIISKNISFPYYGWWSNKKDSIIKMYPKFYKYDHSVIEKIIVIRITKGFGLQTKINNDYIFVSGIDNIINEEILSYL
jgi:hypothetical protein